MNIKNIQWLSISAIVIVLDFLSKWLIATQVFSYQQLRVLPFFNIVHWQNYGAAFSFMNMPGGAQRWLLSLFSLAVIIGLIIWLMRLPRSERWLSASLSLIIGGAAGNLYGRLMQGYVIDFLDFHLGNYHWPAFNVADSAVCIGAAMLAWQLWAKRK